FKFLCIDDPGMRVPESRGIIKDEILFRKGPSNGAILRFRYGNIRINATAIVDDPPTFCMKSVKQRIRHPYISAVVITMDKVQCLYTPSRGGVVFRHRYLHQIVVGNGKCLLHKSFAKTSFTNDNRSV